MAGVSSGKRCRVFGDLIGDLVPADPQPSQVGRPIGVRPGRAGIVGQPVDRVQYLAYALQVIEECGRLADRSFVVFDPQAHRGMPSRRRASSAGTNVVWPTASRAFHTHTTSANADWQTCVSLTIVSPTPQRPADGSR